MIYAPVMIPTVNRYEHLRELIESLQRNEYAKYTELYIGVDYPPSEKYVEGHRKICEYLDAGIEGFAKVVIVKQDHNVGQGMNTHCLKQMIKERFDRYILSEDDNVVSCNFLEYVDRALEIYENDPKIRRICGYSYPFAKGTGDHNVTAVTVSNAWGFGEWINKAEESQATATMEYFERELRCFRKALYCLRANGGSAYYVLECILNNTNAVFCDYKWSVYNNLNHFYCLTPKKAMVHNNGYDGSGLHCGKSDLYSWINEEPLCQEEHFCPDSKYDIWSSEDREKYNCFSNGNSISMIKLECLFLLYSLTGKKGTALFLRCFHKISSIFNRKAQTNKERE